MKIYQLDRKEILKFYDDFDLLQTLPEIGDSVKITFSRQEYYVLQLLILSESDSETVSVRCCCSAGEVTCFNTEGIDKWGHSFAKNISVSKNEIQPLLFGIDASAVLDDKTSCTIEIEGDRLHKIAVEITLTDEKVANKGYNELWRLSRLNWLNSRAFLDQKAVPPYTPVAFEKNDVSVLGRKIEIGKNGLPKQVCSFFDESIIQKDEVQNRLFVHPMEFKFSDEPVSYGEIQFKQKGDNAAMLLNGSSSKLDVTVESDIYYEGFMDYHVRIKAKQDCTFSDICLQTAFSRDASTYNNGFQKHGGIFEDIHYVWDENHQDSVYVGHVNCGMRIKLKAERYVRPLINIYYKSIKREIPVETWANGGKGCVDVVRCDDLSARFSAHTGEYTMRAGEERVFRFELHITPFRPIDYKKHYSVRYRHNCRLRNWEKEIRIAKKNGLTHINVHHGNYINPFINYPFIETEEMKKFIEAAHRENIGVKMYYTSREHSNHMSEIFAYKALGGEIVLRKAGLGHTWAMDKSRWLPAYFGKDYTPAWRVKLRHGKYKGQVDESFIVQPNSRLDNYYIEGLNWLVEETGIDGIYIDDTALDRTTLERARKALSPKNGLIDMHMWNHEEDRAGNISCMNLYTEIFPFIDSLWIGEGYPYSKLKEDYILTEVSGIPYGLLSEMLEGGGNPWCGMLYAMNCRNGWYHQKNAEKIYGLWDDFGIQDAEMRGYWHRKTPIKADNCEVLVTTYIKSDSALVAVYNSSSKALSTSIVINDDLLGFAAGNAQAEYAKIKGLQKFKKANLNKPLRIAPKGGIILVLKNKGI